MSTVRLSQWCGGRGRRYTGSKSGCRLDRRTLLQCLPLEQRITPDDTSAGPNGIDSRDIGLTGAGVHIGQVETGRPGQRPFDANANSHPDVNPTSVFVQNNPAVTNKNITDHAHQTAGVMVATGAANKGVTFNSTLHSSAYVTPGTGAGYEALLLSLQKVASQNGGDVPVVNLSSVKPLVGVADGSSLASLGVDYLAGQQEAMTARFSLLVAALVALVASLCPAGEEPATAPAPHTKRLPPEEIDRLISELGDRDFEKREAATEALKRRPEAALALLRAARTTSNPEVKRRLQSIVPVMMSKEGAEKRLARLPEYAKNLQLDRLIETMVSCREFLTEKHDPPVRAMVRKIYTAAIKDKKYPYPWLGEGAEFPDFKTFAWYNRPGLPKVDRPSIVARVATGGARGVIAADRIEVDGTLGKCVALSNGDVVGLRHGEPTTFDSVESIVIATGTVRLLNSSQASVIVCPGDMVVPGVGVTSVLVSAGRAEVDGDKRYSMIRERETEFFRAWNLYSPVEAGAELWSVFGVVGVRTVIPGSRFHKAGIKPGDILAQIDHTRIMSIRDANRLLCRATVSWGAAELTIIRGHNRHELFVPLCDW